MPSRVFPSSHTATAAGLAIGLASALRGRWLFATFAVLVAGQHMISGYHFLSDTCFGALVGCVFAGCCLHPRLLDDRFTRYREQQAKTAAPDSSSGGILVDAPVTKSRAA